MDPALKAYAAGHVARYTSYPTAREFGPNVGAGDVASWLTKVGQGEQISLYIHIPFCEKLCWYCACATSKPNKYERVSNYVSTLIVEIESWAQHIGGRGKIARIHFGGGSPNMLRSNDLERLINGIRKNFDVNADVEIAMELDPRSLTDAFIDTMARVGVSRVSLGVQTLAPAVQDRINRIQPRKQITRAVSQLRKNGIQQISFDLMYGLPAQTVADVEDAVNYAGMIGVNRVSVFGYAHVPWFVSRQRVIDERALPGIEERYDQVQAADKALKANGYVAVGFDHYALSEDPLVDALSSGRLRRNFQGFTDDDCQTLIGLGESSISSFREGYAQNHKDRKDWSTSVRDRQLPVTRGYVLTADDRVRADIIELLLCYGEVDIATVCSIYDCSVDALMPCLEALRPLERDGLCSIDGFLVTIPEARKFFARQVAAKFDAFTIKTQQHAIAV